MRLATSLLIILTCTLSVLAQDGNTTISTIDDYNGWGWQSIVMKNDLITVATTPVIGARITQYDLGDHSSIFLNPSLFGKTFNISQTWHNYGGYKVWPAPQDRWGWPPPPRIDFGEYSTEITDDTADSVALFVRGPVETQITPNLRMQRRTVIYRGTSRVKVEQSIVNEGSSKQSWSVWDVTQNIVHHNGEKDYENFWVYFPINPDSKFGNDGVRWSDHSGAWKGEVAPGIYGVEFKPEGKKIFADSHKGWICYADEREDMIYAKVFKIWDGADYPDQGARVEVWISSNPLYLEVEVVSPIWDIEANGGKITFVEDWYAAKVAGPTELTPILDVNHVGATAKHLSYDDQAKNFQGLFGVFHFGTAKLVALDAEDNIVAEGQAHDVTPNETFELNETLELPETAAQVKIVVSNDNGDIGTLTMADADALTSVATSSQAPADFALQQNYPNPFNPSTKIEFLIPSSQHVNLSIIDVKGREVATLVNQRMSSGSHQVTWHAANQPAGVYFIRLKGERLQNVRTKKMVLAR